MKTYTDSQIKLIQDINEKHYVMFPHCSKFTPMFNAPDLIKLGVWQADHEKNYFKVQGDHNCYYPDIAAWYSEEFLPKWHADAKRGIFYPKLVFDFYCRAFENPLKPFDETELLLIEFWDKVTKTIITMYLEEDYPVGVMQALLEFGWNPNFLHP